MGCHFLCNIGAQFIFCYNPVTIGISAKNLLSLVSSFADFVCAKTPSPLVSSFWKILLTMSLRVGGCIPPIGRHRSAFHLLCNIGRSSSLVTIPSPLVSATGYLTGKISIPAVDFICAQKTIAIGIQLFENIAGYVACAGLLHSVQKHDIDMPCPIPLTVISITSFLISA